MNDIFLYMLNLARDLIPNRTSIVIFMGVALLSFLVELFVYRTQHRFIDFFRFCFPPKGWTSRSVAIDLALLLTGKVSALLTGVFDTAITVAAAALVTAGLQWLFPNHTALHAGLITSIALTIVLAVAVDFGLFWTHYLEHNVDFLWEIHKVHHSATFLNPMTAVRTHPLSERFETFGVALTVFVPMGLIMFLYGLNYVEIALLLAAAGRFGGIITLEILHHTQFPISYGWLDYILVSPRVHQAHHSAKYEHWDRNMGVRLSIWDAMFGTLVLPPKEEIVRSGIGRGEAYDGRYHTLHGAFVQPVIDSVRVLLGKPVAEFPPPESLAEKGLTEPVPETK